MYRILLIKGTFKLATITNPGKAIPDSFTLEWYSFLRKRFLKEVEGYTGFAVRNAGSGKLERPTPFAITKASADKPAQGIAETSFATRFNSACRWLNGEWGPWLLRFLRAMPGGAGTTKSLYTMMAEVAEASPLARSRTSDPTDGSPLSGRLSTKPEPAGKIRVFAIVDYWSQIALKPLHDWLFSVLREIPQDGTFDQLAPVKRLLSKVKLDQTIYSYDLSAATDRLPVLIQAQMLSLIFGKRFASAWRGLLVDRTYGLSRLVRKIVPGLPWVELRDSVPTAPKGVFGLRYAVGQPMGAYSSWGMLAFTHHALVQFAAYRAGYTKWFALYAVLGDDVVIADDSVAREYRRVCSVIGLEIGIAKSLIAKGKTLEFAKKLFFRGEDLSGLPIKFWAAAQNTMGVAHALSAWYPGKSLATFVRALGVGFKGASKVDVVWEKLPKRLRILLVLLTQPLSGGAFAAPTWVDWLMSKSPKDFGYDKDALTEFTPWATSLIEEVLNPYRDLCERNQEDIFFSEPGSWDPAGRAVDSLANRSAVSATDSLEKAEKSMKHLQRLNIRFNVVQCSAIWQQVVAVAGKVDLISPTVVKAHKREPEVKVAPMSEFYSLWSRLRKRVTDYGWSRSVNNTGEAKVDPYDRLKRTSPKSET